MEDSNASATDSRNRWHWKPGQDARHVAEKTADDVEARADCGALITVDFDEAGWMLPTCPACFHQATADQQAEPYPIGMG